MSKLDTLSFSIVATLLCLVENELAKDVRADMPVFFSVWVEPPTATTPMEEGSLLELSDLIYALYWLC